HDRPWHQRRVEPAAEAEAHQRAHAAVGDPTPRASLGALWTAGGGERDDVERAFDTESEAAKLAPQPRDDADLSHAAKHAAPGNEAKRERPRAKVAHANPLSCPLSWKGPRLLPGRPNIWTPG